MTGKSQAKTKCETPNGTCGISEKRRAQDDYFLFTSYIRSYAHSGRLKQMEADNKKGA